MTDSPPPKSRRRWCQFTLDRFLVGLLAVELFLLLSERFSWLPFNQRKGTALLIAATVAGLGVLFLLLGSALGLLMRRHFQFGVRSLLLVTLLVTVVSSWHAVNMASIRAEKQAIDSLSELGAWGMLVGEEDDIEGTCLAFNEDWQGRGDDLALLKDISTLRLLQFDNEGISPDDLGVLNRLTELAQLAFRKTRVTDQTVVYIAGLQKLRSLELAGPVTDQGLTHLKGLRRLEELTLSETRVSDALIEEFLAELPTLAVVERRAILVNEDSFCSSLQSAYPEPTPSKGKGDEDDPFYFAGEQAPQEYLWLELIDFCRDMMLIEIELDAVCGAVCNQEVSENASSGLTFEEYLTALADCVGLEPVIQSDRILITSKEKAARIAPQRWRVTWRRHGDKIVVDRAMRIVLPNNEDGGDKDEEVRD